jgi:hypothetical protein
MSCCFVFVNLMLYHALSLFHVLCCLPLLPSHDLINLPCCCCFMLCCLPSNDMLSTFLFFLLEFAVVVCLLLLLFHDVCSILCAPLLTTHICLFVAIVHGTYILGAHSIARWLFVTATPAPPYQYQLYHQHILCLCILFVDKVLVGVWCVTM